MNYLFCSVGRRGELLKDFRKSIAQDSLMIAADNSPYAPALYMADKRYIVPAISDPNYIDILLGICKENEVRAVTTFIDPEIALLARHRERFEAVGTEVIAPYTDTADICFDKYLMYKHLVKNGIPTVMTWDTLEAFEKALSDNVIRFPVFVKPRTGSGSVGARLVKTEALLREAMEADPGLIIQEYMNCLDLDADVYVDTISHRAVSAFSKKKIETRIGGASKTVSFKDPKLFAIITRIVDSLRFNGPIDMDFFCRDGEYYLSEINPRFGGAYLHAYGAGVDFIRMIETNMRGIENHPSFGEYEEGVVMMMYDSVVIKREAEIGR